MPPPRPGQLASALVVAVAACRGGPTSRTVSAASAGPSVIAATPASIATLPRPLDADTPIKADSGASFEAPGPGVEKESLAGRIAHPMNAERMRLLEAFVADSMARARVPGVAIAVVQGGRLAYAAGFGVRELGKTDRVTPETLFMIGSATKSLTTLMMAKLVDEGRFGWDTPVSQLLPSFALADPDITRRVAMKDTVCACAGLPRQDMEFLFEYAGVTPEQRLQSMRTMRPTTGFGETFQYSNLMVAAGAYAAAHTLDGEKKLGPVYDEAMQTRVFGPLGMKNTTLDFATVRKREHATPHASNLKLDVAAIPLADEEGVVPIRPAGAVWSNVLDMSRYVLFELAKGRDPSGSQLVSEVNLLKRREPQIKVTDTMAYGLGLFVEDDHGVRIVHHGGNSVGFTTDMYFLPEHDVGVVMLTNAGGANALRSGVRRRVLELLFDARDEAAKRLDFALAREHEAADRAAAKLAASFESSWSKAVVGSYANAGLGAVVVRIDGAAGTFDAGEWKSSFGEKMESDGTRKLVLLDPPLAGLELISGEKDGTGTLTLQAGQETYTFEMQARSRPADR